MCIGLSVSDIHNYIFDIQNEQNYFLLGKTPISDIYSPIVTSHHFNFRYPKWKTIPDIHNVILNIQKHILTGKNVILDTYNCNFTRKNTIVDIYINRGWFPA